MTGPQDPEEKSEPSERRQFYRVSLSAEQFRLAENGKIFQITDLSENGLAIRVLDRQDFILFSVGRKLKGTLNLGSEKCRVEIWIKSNRGSVVGCEFTDATEPEMLAAIKKYLSPEEMGKRFHPLPSTDFDSVWFCESSGNYFMYRHGAQGPEDEMAIYFFGNFVRWSKTEGLQSGLCKKDFDHPDSEDYGVFQHDTLVLKADESPDPEKLALAKRLIQAIDIETNHKKWCLSLL